MDTGGEPVMVATLRDAVYGQALTEARPVRADVASLPEESIRSGGYVLDTVLASVWCLLTTDSYADCVLKAVNLGSDADSGFRNIEFEHGGVGIGLTVLGAGPLYCHASGFVFRSPSP